MNASYAAALRASRDVAGPQDLPAGALFVIATPIGNLADITLRALHLLQTVDLLACEDTRHTQALLRAYGIEAAGQRLLALHQHNEREASERVVAALQAGQRVGFVSDAGTPGVSDPGALLVQAVQQAGLRVVPIPGVSSVTTALSVAGLPAMPELAGLAGGVLLAGFLPARGAERDAAVLALQQEARAVVLLESPHRIEALAQALVVLGERRVTVGRELTKQFEEVATLAAQGLGAWLQATAKRTRGEFVLVVHPQAPTAAGGAAEGERVLGLLLQALPVKGAVQLASAITGEPRNALYARALALRGSGEGEA